MKILIFLIVFLCPTWAFSQVDQIRTDVEYLADDARRGRYTGSPGIKEAQEYIMAALRAENIPTFSQPVGSCTNVIGFIRGAQPETYIVVGAHLDHTGVERRRVRNRAEERIQNGADDNASGSAAILELAKRVSRIRPLRSVVFVWFTGEEIGFLGSKEFVRRPFDGDFEVGNALPVGMLNLDMVGHLNRGTQVDRSRFRDPGELDNLYKKYVFARRITRRGANLAGDTAPFEERNVPTLWLFTGTHSLYHTSRDDPDTLDYEGINRVCDYAYDIILQTAGRHEYKVW